MSGEKTISEWLDRHGLTHLLEVFETNGIELDILQDLTSDDLTEVGITLGDRKRVLKALTNSFGTASPAPLIEENVAVGQTNVRTIAAERRQITVLFCDLVGSSQLLGKLDPEESRTVIRSYRNVIAAEVDKFGGHVAQYLGDGVLAYFGWPLAIEDAAVRAVTAATNMLQAVARIRTQHGEHLAIRIGVATGLVVVGGSETKDITEDMTAVGGAVNLAARLQEFAIAGQILVSGPTKLLVAEKMALESKGFKTFKGFSESEEVFAVTSELVSPRRARQSFERTMLGRDEEANLALSRWRKAKAGSGQVVVISGEPGIGKSHLTERLVETMTAEGARVHRYVCSPFLQSKALHPVLEHLRHEIGFMQGDPAADCVGKLHTYLVERAVEPEQAMPFLLQLLSIDSEQWPEPDGTTPMIRKARSFAALNAVVQNAVAASLLLVILEDAHWIDPTTIEYFEQLIGNTRQLPVLVLINARPNFRHQWQDNGNITTIALQKIGRSEIEGLIASECSGTKLPPDVIKSIVERSDGVPLFVEELTKSVLETRLGGKGSLAEIPSSLRDTLMARLDRIPQARHIAQIAACIGRECDHELLFALAEKSLPQMQEALDVLANAEILFSHGTAPHFVYHFKHALVQEAAEDCLLKTKRRDIHLRIAQYIEVNRVEFSKARPELLAHHFTQAAEYEKALYYRQEAAQIALAASGNREAIGEFGLALELIAQLPPSAARDTLELKILIAQAVPYTLTLGYAAPEVEAVYKRAMDANARLPVPSQNFAVIYGFWRFYLLRGNYVKAKQLSEQLSRIAVVSGDRAVAVTANRAEGATRFYMAQFQESLQFFERVSAIAPEAHLRNEILTYDVVDPWVVNHAYSGTALWMHGMPAEAILRSDQAIALARQVNHPFTLALALCFAQWTHQFCGDRERVKELATEALALSHKHGFTFWTGWAEILLAWAESENDVPAARQRMKSALQLWQSTGSQLGLSYFQCLLAEQCDGAEALKLLDMAEKFALENEELFWLPEIYLQSGRLAMQQGGEGATEAAETFYRKAIALSDKLQAHGHSERAAIAMERLQGSL